jgi:hypothetical protein
LSPSRSNQTTNPFEIAFVGSFLPSYQFVLLSNRQAWLAVGMTKNK